MVPPSPRLPLRQREQCALVGSLYVHLVGCPTSWGSLQKPGCSLRTVGRRSLSGYSQSCLVASQSRQSSPSLLQESWRCSSRLLCSSSHLAPHRAAGDTALASASVPGLLGYRQWAPWLPGMAPFCLCSSPSTVPLWVQPSLPGLLCFWGFAVETWGRMSGLEDGVRCWINPISARNCFALWANGKRWRFTWSLEKTSPCCSSYLCEH